MGRGVVVIEVGIDRVLVLIALLVLGLDPVLVEEALEEDVLVGQTHGLERGSRLHPQLVGRGAQHIGRGDHARGIEPLAVGIDRLSGGAEMLDRQPDLVGGGGLDPAFWQADQHAGDLGVGLGPPQGLDHAHHRHRAAAEGGEGVVGILIGQGIAQIQVQHGMGWNRLRLGRAGGHDDQQERHPHQEEHEAGEHARRGDQELLHSNPG
ncbi:hypothetical protein GALL_515250 [mine drainage metagenome]|uniref:Uncharacterized protein n=1 Tax=mine drainage metagenome TaxID=410659 RepID=A0A1J5PGH7_9ZZZZ